jgi:hypothetical protein
LIATAVGFCIGNAMKSNRLTDVLLSHAQRYGVIECPLVLVSQISRSGGTFLSQLLDGHPELWAHPHELHVGHPHKWHWTDLSGVLDAEEAFGLLQQKRFATKFRGGYYSKGNEQELPMVYDPELHRELFVSLTEAHKPMTDRQWLNLFFTALFSAWLDYQGRYEPKRFVSAFASMFSIERPSMAKFNEAYRDGSVISLLREPLGWYASVKQRSINVPRKGQQIYAEGIRIYGGFEEAEKGYIENADSILRNRQLLGSRLILIDYSALAKKTEAVMRHLADRLGIQFSDILLRPTFNRMPISSNTSFAGGASDSRSSILTEDDLSRIRDGVMMARYRQLAPLCEISGQ